MPNRETADLAVVGAGTIGGWASVFARERGAERVVVLERARAAGRVLARGRHRPGAGRHRRRRSRSACGRSTSTAQRERYGTDSGFRSSAT